MGFTQIDNEPYVYVIVRKDLSLPQQVVQACHATLESVRLKPPKPPQVHPNIIVCGAKDEQKLLKYAAKIERAGIQFALFQEPDRDNEYTALATEPVRGEDRRPFRDFQCLTTEE